MSHAAIVPIGIVTVSDRASRGVYEDRGGPAIAAELTRMLTTPWRAEMRLVADELSEIAAALRDLADTHACPLIVTTGGTGPAPRDVTPEATEQVCDKMMPGFGELMRATSLRYVPTAILSRQTAGIRGRSLIVNLPGQPKAIGETMSAIMPAIPYCIDLIGGAFLETDPSVVVAFRPKAK
jgi:molybdopterin adenylyltransferase